MTSDIKATVIITTFDRYDLVPGAISSVLHQDLDCSHYEVVVVDNLPDPIRHRTLVSEFKECKNVRIIKEERKGLSYARNAGVAVSNAPVICFMDDDALAQQGWLVEILNAFEFGSGKVGVVGGAIAPKWSGPVPAWLTDRHLGHLSVVSWGGEMRIARDSEWFAGCNIAFNKKSLVDAGGFNPSLGRSGGDAVLLSNDEIDVIKRIENDGKLRVYAPKARVEHIIDPARVSASWLRRRLAWQAVSDFLMDPEASGEYASIAADRTRRRLNPTAVQFGLWRLIVKLQQTEKQSNTSPEIDYVYDAVMALLSGEDIVDKSS